MIVIYSTMIFVNNATSYVTKLHGKYVLFSMILLVIGFIEHKGRCSPKGEGYIIALVKIHVKNIRPRSWDMYSKLNG